MNDFDGIWDDDDAIQKSNSFVKKVNITLDRSETNERKARQYSAVVNSLMCTRGRKQF